MNIISPEKYAFWYICNNTRKATISIKYFFEMVIVVERVTYKCLQTKAKAWPVIVGEIVTTLNWRISIWIEKQSGGVTISFVCLTEIQDLSMQL